MKILQHFHGSTAVVHRPLRLSILAVCLALQKLVVVQTASVFGSLSGQPGSNEVLQFNLSREGFQLGGPSDSDDFPGLLAFDALTSKGAEPRKVFEASAQGERLTGWFLSAWEGGKCNRGKITEQTVKEAARRAGGSLAHLLGMRYFAVDSCWLQEDPPKPEAINLQEIKTNEVDFPYGMTSIAKTVKNHGLIFGLGVTVSSEKCPDLEPSPSKAREIDLIHKASEWGASFLKLNACSSSHAQAVADFKRWSDAARASSTQPFLICTWTRETPETNKDPRASELLSLCDAWISAERRSTDWHQLKSSLDAWLLTQTDQPRRRSRQPPAPRFALPESLLNPTEAQRHTKAALAMFSDIFPRVVAATLQKCFGFSFSWRKIAALGSQLVVEASSMSQFNEQANLLHDKIVLAGAADPQSGEVRRRPGPGGSEVLSRQLADGDYVVAVVNWTSSPLSVSATHADVLAWCGLENPVPLLVELAWSEQRMHLTSGHGAPLKQEIPPYGTMLLQVELTDNLADSQEAVVIADSHSAVWTSSELPLFPVMDVFHREDLPPAFTSANRVVHAQPQDALTTSNADQGARGRAFAGRDNTASSLDLFFKTALNLLLPVMVASAFNDEEKTKKHKTHRHHKRHHHHHKHKHKNHESDQQKHEEHEPLAHDDTHLHVQSSLRHSTVERAAVKGTTGEESELAVVSDAAHHKAEPENAASSSAAWMLLSALVVVVCLAVVAAWRALMLRLNTRKQTLWEVENTQLVQRPHLH
ncbi:hypothetical protein Emed_003933 [Eimeria media]